MVPIYQLSMEALKIIGQLSAPLKSILKMVLCHIHSKICYAMVQQFIHETLLELKKIKSFHVFESSEEILFD